MSEDVRLIDWEFATSAGRRWTPSGPKVDASRAAREVAALRSAALRAQAPVAEITGLSAPSGGPEALVVDRATWTEVNATSFAHVLDPVVARTFARRSRPAPPEAVQRIGGKVTGTEIAGLLAFLSTKVLGQFELAPGQPDDAARLLLVAPNIVAVTRELKVDPDDFRLWVCLHEETHRVQFTAVPWLREHMLTRMDRLVDELAPDADLVLARLRQALANAGQVMRAGGGGMAELFLTEEQREHVAQVSAVMALLEGHADVVMDAVGPAVVPSVAHIRAVFDARREGVGVFDVIVRRLLGLEAKMAQYREGAAFVRGVVDKVGMSGFNAVWSEPDYLPSPAEIAEPARWITRVHG